MSVMYKSGDFPGGPVVVPMKRVWSLVKELRSHMPHDQKKKKQNINQKQYYYKFNKDIKNGPH